MPRFHNQKGFISNPIIFIVIILALGGYLFYRNTDLEPKKVTSNQPTGDITLTPTSTPDIKLDPDGKNKIYTNHIENYSFKSPADWTLSQKFNTSSYQDPRIKTPDNITVSIFPPGEPTEGDRLPFATVVEITVQKPQPRANEADVKKGQESFEQAYLKSNTDDKTQRTNKVASLTVDGKKAIQTITKPIPGDIKETVYAYETQIRNGVNIYSIKFRGTEKIVQANFDAYKQILNSFKFTGPEPTFTQPTLQTYTNEKYGYSFQYPSNWLVNSFQGDYNKGIAVVDENDREVFNLSQEKRYGKCPPASYYGKDYAYPKKEVQIGETMATLILDCDHPRVVTSKGQEFKMLPDIFVEENIRPADPRVLNLLKSIQGLKVIQ